MFFNLYLLIKIVKKIYFIILILNKKTIFIARKNSCRGIAEIDPDYTLQFEPIPFPDTFSLFGGYSLNTFSETPVDNIIRKQMFNVHSYCCSADQNTC